jgi:hypothetical protein
MHRQRRPPYRPGVRSTSRPMPLVSLLMASHAPTFCEVPFPLAFGHHGRLYSLYRRSSPVTSFDSILSIHFLPNASSWDFYHVSAGRRQSRNRLCRLGGLTSLLPGDSRAATVSSHGTHAHLLAFALPPAPARDSLSSPTFSQLVDSLPASSSWSVKELALPSDLRALLSALRSGSARAVSDGSFKDKFGTSSFDDCL